MSITPFMNEGRVDPGVYSMPKQGVVRAYTPLFNYRISGAASTQHKVLTVVLFFYAIMLSFNTLVSCTALWFRFYQNICIFYFFSHLQSPIDVFSPTHPNELICPFKLLTVEGLYCKRPIQCLASSEILPPHHPASVH